MNLMAESDDQGYNDGGIDMKFNKTKLAQ